MLTGVFAGDGGDLGCEQSEQRAIFVGGPHRAVAAEEAGAGALFAAEAAGTTDKSGDKPFKAYRNFP